MSAEFRDPSYYEDIEQRTKAEVASDAATTGELEGNVFDICGDCPLVGFPQEELDGSESGVGWSACYPGQTTVTIRLRSSGGKWSKNILLGAHPGNSIGGRRIAKIYDEAAGRTQECQGPRKFPPFLGPIAIKTCRALEQAKSLY